MQVSEFAKKKGLFSKGYALGINLLVESPEDLMEKFRHVAEEVLGWNNVRGKSCETLMFTILCAQEHHPEIKRFLEQVYLHENNLGPLFQKWTVNVSLMSENGKPIEDYELAPTESA